MSDIEYNEPEYTKAPPRRAEQASYLTRLVVSLGLAKSAQGAQRVMLITAVVCSIIGWYFFTHGA